MSNVEVSTHRLNLSDIMKAGKLSDQDKALLDSLGFVVFNEDDAYTDIRYEYTFEGDPEDAFRKSVEWEFTFAWLYDDLFQSVGLNIGDGYESELTVEDDGSRCFADQLLEAYEQTGKPMTEEFRAVFSQEPIRSKVLAAAKRLTSVVVR